MPKNSVPEICSSYSTVKTEQKKGQKLNTIVILPRLPARAVFRFGGTWKGTRHRIMPWAA